MATKKAKKAFPLKHGLTAAFVNDDIVIGSKVEFFFTTEEGTATSAVGRVCNIKGSSLCCVQFVKFGCQQVPKKKLVLTTKAAPDCTEDCENC